MIKADKKNIQVKGDLEEILGDIAMVVFYVGQQKKLLKDKSTFFNIKKMLVFIEEVLFDACNKVEKNERD